ncbi:MAG TPA: MmgE/PrpD family protein [candidate division Zixibacteria bacterium]|nr:MmgE/PrpD family protein [candidate division Zixibacteria bacterium]
MGPTQTLARFVAETRIEAIPGQAVETAKLVILDALGVTLAGSRQPAGRILMDYARGLGAAPEASVIGSDLKTAPELAALVNGSSAFILDFDDDLHGSIHTLPAALALGERRGAGGSRLLEAYILGREVCSRLDAALDAGRALNLGGPTSRGWFAGGTTGSLAAAAAAGKILGLDVKRMCVAFGIAASLAGGLRRNFGTMTKALHGGNAARNGVLAASLAAAGFSADEEILEAHHGLVDALCLKGECRWEALGESLGKDYYLERLPTIKAYPACSPSHRPIDGLLKLRREHGFGPEDVESIECDFHLRSLCRVDPREGIAGHNSMPFILALALLEDKVVIDQFTDERVRDPLVRSIMERIRHVPRASESGKGERLTVRLKNGKTYAIEVADRRTLTTESDIHAKYTDCATRAVRPQDAERVWELVRGLERLESLVTLADLLSGRSR